MFITLNFVPFYIMFCSIKASIHLSRIKLHKQSMWCRAGVLEESLGWVQWVNTLILHFGIM